ncbi:MAG: hypothetical protein V3T84_13005 [Phycisphaerales bacterium]
MMTPFPAHTSAPAPAPGNCPWDLDGSGSVGASDLLSLLVSWGPCKDCPADFDDNGSVGASDLLALLANLGRVRNQASLSRDNTQSPGLHRLGVFVRPVPLSLPLPRAAVHRRKRDLIRLVAAARTEVTEITAGRGWTPQN